ncbi:TetR/AcrR family transcriptional regulator [Phytohabitans rumicis]|uniref:TetR family transcriptional regulator n=1 Tax=Phytohabitans rumicis TaxID=1076125 RepID=A0A6V8L4F2_9ACTN|nr:TetR/AcrR family transcriptional regulator [Phytohabitans rumicis]GFJ89026.1 TetR family transcriptional regulator [Phytohabitans rumicis]
MTTTSPTRRERLRSATVAEIKDGARRMLAAGGPQAISLRAIARDMGMTAPAIYRYFPSLDALILALAEDLLHEVADTVAAATAAAGDSPGDQLAAMARAFRRWSVAHPVEFALIFGNPGVADLAPDYGPDHPGACLGRPYLDALLGLWQQAPWPTPPREDMLVRLGPHLGPLRESHGDPPIEVAYTFLSGWTRLYGLVAMEIFNQLRWAITSPEALFETEIQMFLIQLGVTAD